MSRVWGGATVAKQKTPQWGVLVAAQFAQQMEGPCPDKRFPNKITSEMQTHRRSEVPVEHKIFKN